MSIQSNNNISKEMWSSTDMDGAALQQSGLIVKVARNLLANFEKENTGKFVFYNERLEISYKNTKKKER